MQSLSCSDIRSAACPSSIGPAGWSGSSRKATSYAGRKSVPNASADAGLIFLAGADRVALDFARSHGRKVGDIMTANPITISQDTPLADIVEIMEAHNVKRLPVMTGDRLVGMVTHTDFLPAVARLARVVKSSAKDGSVQDDNRIRELFIATMA